MRPNVGWIGLGNIGLPMARRVAAAGFPLRVWSRRAAEVWPFVAEGVTRAERAESLAAASDVVATIVGGPDDVRDLLRRMIPQARPGTIFVEMTTASPVNASEAASLAQRAGVAVLDAPVTGGVGGAERGTLTAFVGGDGAARERARPVLEAFCARIVACGSAGDGYRMKLVNQTIVAGTLLGVAQGAALARAAGFAAGAVKEALGTGTASGFLFDAYVARMVDLAGPVGFTLGMLRKDLALARAEALDRGASIRLIDFALASVDAARAEHGDRAGVQFLGAPDPR